MRDHKIRTESHARPSADVLLCTSLAAPSHGGLAQGTITSMAFGKSGTRGGLCNEVRHSYLRPTSLALW